MAPPDLVSGKKRDPAIYDPEKGLKQIAVGEAAEKYFTRTLRKTKDPFAREQLLKAISAKIDAQAKYVVWRDRIVAPPGKRNPTGANQHKKRGQITALQSGLPPADPGDVVAHRWRKRFCIRDGDKRVVVDPSKISAAKLDAELSCQRICEQQNMGTVRGTEGTGELERYTPDKYLEAARTVLGEIDLDPATSKQAQETVKATQYYTEKDDGLAQEWCGRIWLNPPYHRELAPRFIDKLVAEFAAGRVSAAVMLTNNSTDTDWCDAAARACAGICFTHGRIHFTQPNGSEVLPTQGQAFFYFGNDVQRFEDVFCVIGFCVRPSRQYEGTTK